MCNDKIVEVLKQVKDLDNQKIFLFADTLEKKSKLRNLFEKTKVMLQYHVTQIMS